MPGHCCHACLTGCSLDLTEGFLFIRSSAAQWQLHIPKQGTMKKKTNDYSSVQKAIEILMAFMPDGREMGTLEISRKLGIHKSTVSRLIGVLTYHNLLKQNGETKKYMLGRVVADLGKVADLSFVNQLQTIAQPIMNKLRDTIGESVALEVMYQNEVTVVSEAPGQSVVRVAFEVNQKVPMHVAAGSKAILAYSPPELVDSCIKGTLQRYTADTVTDPEAFKKRLKQIARKGVAFDRGEFHQDVHSIGAPIFDSMKRPVAAIATCMIESRMKKLLKNDLVSLVKEAADEVSAKIMFSDREAA